MKNNIDYNLRLLRFADYLAGLPKPHPEKGLIEEVNIVTVDEGINIHYSMRYHYYIVNELPCVFDEWYWDQETGNALCEGCDPQAGSIGSFTDFFGLDEDALVHLLDIDGYQNIERFGGQILTEDSDALIIANNIVDYVQYRREHLS